MNYSFGMVPMFAGCILRATRMAAGIRILVLITTWAQFSIIGAAQTLPYIPSSIFIPESKPAPAQDNATVDVAYIFTPQGDRVNLLALNFSSTLRASSLSPQILSSDVPFRDSNNTAFIPSLADNGSLIVYAGDCSSPESSEIWTFNPSPNDDASSTWMQASTTLDTEAADVQVGPSFLGSGFSFSNTLEPQLSPASTYVYGGMCPNTTSNEGSAQSKATYSNQMIKIAPSEAGTGKFTVGPVSSKGPPVPEAGFTFSGLSPSISNRSGIVTQQVNYVLLGGHTQYAFINMSTVAIWSLPEESWSFISNIGIGNANSGNTELAVKSANIDNIDSRSGHTAVLSEDGTSLVIFGGWVGDLTQAATPQLAILNIGSNYGGNGDWHWSVPDTQPSGPGIYGHGAALLPGNIMMVYGGYSISSAGATTKRQASGGNDVPMFLNLTSMSWSDDYTNPEFIETDSDGNSSNDSDVGKRLGLGLGLGLGFLAIIIGVSLALIYRRRQRHRRTIRDSAIRALAQDVTRFLPHEDEMIEQDHSGGVWYTGGADPYLRGSRSLGYQSLQMGHGGIDNGQQQPHSWWFGGAPAPRKPLPRRNTYDPPSSVIHPIIEADEDGSLHDGDITSEPLSPERDEHAPRNDSDPFLTPTHEKDAGGPSFSFPPPSRSSATPSPEDPRPRNATTDPEVQDWMSDVEAVDALLTSHHKQNSSSSSSSNAPGRRPGKANRFSGPYPADEDARTESNVSESNRSNLIASRPGSSRSTARRAGAGAGAGLSVSATALAAAADEGGRLGSSDSSAASASAPSYNTARSSFAALRAEGPGLLMGRGRGGGGGDGENNNDDDGEDEVPGSPSKSKPRRSWLGSLRRVFTGPSPTPSPPESPDRETPMGEGFAETSDYDMRLGGLSGIAAGGLLRRKSGRGDWEALEQGQWQQGARGKGKGKEKDVEGAAGEDDDEEWDIEKAVERRLVQVMFTVPKEPLRVVNAEPDIESGKDVVVVDQEKDERASVSTQEKQQPIVIEEQDLGTPLPSPTTDEEKSLREDAEKEILREVGAELDAEWKTSRDRDRGRQIATPTRGTPPVSQLREESIRLLGAEPSSSESRKRKPSRSPIQDLDGDVFSAQAVKLERPRTRVLAMVQSIESLSGKSHESSPAASPAR